jgi:uncharacterized membrane protein YadS
VATVLEASELDIALAIATVFLYNVAAVLVFPPLGHLMGLSQPAFGLWAGTAINDTSSVVAAGFTYGTQAGQHATIVKLVRATFILPIVAAIAFLQVRRAHAPGKSVPWSRIVPWFIVWFVVAAAIGSWGVISTAWQHQVAFVTTFCISVALAAIGLQTDLVRFARAGARPLALGSTIVNRQLSERSFPAADCR